MTPTPEQVAQAEAEEREAESFVDAQWKAADAYMAAEWPHATDGERALARSIWTELARNNTELAGLRAENDRLQALINTPELDSFLRAVHIEAVHQVERWGEAHDRAKRPADWFWLVGYLAGKALHSAIAGGRDKARHHCISSAAALYNWHSAISGRDVRMCPGRSDLAIIVDEAFPGEAPAAEPDPRMAAVMEAYGGVTQGG